MSPQRIDASGRRFLLIDGIRRWLDEPPAHMRPDLLPIPICPQPPHPPRPAR